MGLTTEDEGPGINYLQGIPSESGKGNRSEVEGGMSIQRRKIPRAIQRILSVDGNPIRVHCAKDARIEWTGREDELDHHGESPEYASICQVVQDVMG